MGSEAEGWFTRATVPKKSKSVTIEENSVPPPLPRDEDTQQQPVQKQKGRGRPPKSTEAPRNVTFETPNGKLPTRPLRRTSKRLAEEEPTATVTEKSLKPRRKSNDVAPAPIMVQRKRGSSKAKGSQTEPLGEETEGQVTTPLADVNTQKIALPFADTPVIQKNKEMRMEKSQKGQRRSSLGRRGRRASWLIESGVSNALPHDQVDTAHFYKHIESRVIQEELLEDFANRPELSDWFGRQETTPPAVVVKKPNPRNIQNAEKIKELEEQIHKLQLERQSLTSLVRPPSIPKIKPPSSTSIQQSENQQPSTCTPQTEVINPALLDSSQLAILTALNPLNSTRAPSDESAPTAQTDSSCTSISNITFRLSHLTTSLIPTLDSFASGIHDIELFRRAADDVAGQVLAICARLLEERDQLRQKRIGGEELGSNANGRTMRTRRRKGKQKVGEAAEGDEGAGNGGDADEDEKDDLRIEKEDLAIVLAALKVEDSAYLELVNTISQAYPPIVFED
ncbi:Mis12-Mtw1 domain-containing protein [Histoplasma capsulatum]|uniref:Mis12-Mtw1 domain-containing protein n=1 Tax=Ajellomyces capsulatus TaxID=5037 RepID=A0A8A1LXI9_AJECA|nr:Mis12-Mtw1 domain-containing protein [Histoplasma capsulatum]